MVDSSDVKKAYSAFAGSAINRGHATRSSLAASSTGDNFPLLSQSYFAIKKIGDELPKWITGINFAGKTVAQGILGLIPIACSSDDLQTSKNPVLPDGGITPIPTDDPAIIPATSGGDLAESKIIGLENYCENPQSLMANQSTLVATCANSFATIGDDNSISLHGLPENIFTYNEQLKQDELTNIKYSAAITEGDIVFAAFSESVVGEVENNYFTSAGITSYDPANSESTPIVFDTIDMTGPNGVAQVADSAGATVSVLRPNDILTILALTFNESKRLVAISNNPIAKNSAGEITYAPATFTMLDIIENVALPAFNFGDNANRLPKVNFVKITENGNDIFRYVKPDADRSKWDLSNSVLSGQHIIASAAATDDTNFIMVSNEGLVSFWNYLGESTQSDLTLGFSPNRQNTTAIISKYRGQEGSYAVLGTADKSGRIAVVDLNASVDVETPVHYIKVFDTENSILSVTAEGNLAYVVDDAGLVYTVDLSDDSIITRTVSLGDNVSTAACVLQSAALSCFTNIGLARIARTRQN